MSRDTRTAPTDDEEPHLRRFTPLAVAVATLMGLLVSPVGSAAQYFGRNKVQYQDFDFRVLETENFDIHFYEGMSEQAIRDAGRMAERWYERFARTFQHAFRKRKPILFYANQPDFQQTNAIPGFISQATGGVTEGVKNRVVLPFAESYGATDHVLGHELVHAFQYDIAQAGRRGGGSTGFQQLPLWTVEGLAEYLSVGRRSSHTAMWMRDAVLRDDFPTIQELAKDPQYFPYRYGHALWAYVGGRWGDETVPAFYREAARSGLKRASKNILGQPLDTLSSQWRTATREHFSAAMEGRTPPGEAGDRLIPAPGEDPRLIGSPAVSPDGEHVAFLSNLDLFTVDLYLADARTGEVEGKLASAASDPHLDGLAFINSSGAWSPDGSRFAFAAYAEGDNRILVADAEERSVVARHELEGVGAVFGMTWSPDGSTLAFAGNEGGVTDLFLLHLESGRVERLTDDRYTELHPAWSPDGSTLAFTTDRGGTTDLGTLTSGPTGLGFMDVKSRRIRVVRAFEGAKHIDPAFAPDGRSVYFISDPGGFIDVYRMGLGGGNLRQVTRLATGVSGITALSPALTVARDDGRVLFTVFTEGSYALHSLSTQEAEGGEVVASPGGPSGVLPPVELKSPVWVSAYLNDATTGLPEPGAFQTRDYEANLSLDYIAQPTGGISVDRYGTALGGSVAAFFSDMLGNQQLGVALHANGQVEDIGGQIAYQSLDKQMNWSLQGGRIPYRTVRTRIGTTEIGGQEVRTVDLVQRRTILNRATAGIRYPFSTTRRFEADAGYTRMNFDREAIRTLVSTDGRVLDRREVELSAPPGLDLYHASAALVEDRSFSAFTSPVRGARGRLEVEANTGSLTFANVLADYRRYFFFRPVTLAFRGMHYGRYGADAESDRMTPLFLGFERFVRGYDPRSFDGAECSDVPGEPQACPEFDRLIGSRIAVANAELRLPLIGTEQFGLLSWGFVPTELSVFADGGLAWTSEESPELRFEERSVDRIPVFSTGVSARFNILGRFVLEAYYAYPFQRPGTGGIWGFQMAPGW